MTSLDRIFAVALIVALAAALLWLGRAEERLAGPVRVIDGDTLAFGDRRIRLRGLDAPELDQTCQRADDTAYRCGETARDALRRLVRTGPVTCLISGRDRYGRGLARCEAFGTDLGAALVQAGLAVAYGGYAGEEQEARTARRGLWAGRFERPDAWRRERGRDVRTSP
ncbi:MAG: thermonuclease family protein [Methylobacteriaceae bacterium]|nr:thermonuclease family protein [Methylobacteriaceae bacterium]